MSLIKNALIGLAVGDALGVPVEFKDRNYLEENPVTDMIGYGTYKQPAGTWSDDSSLTFCLAESLCNGYNIVDIAEKMTDWYFNKLWTPHGDIFDIGIQTKKSLFRLKHLLIDNKLDELLIKESETSEQENGNGSLMRILPLAFILDKKDLNEIFEKVSDVSALTHEHMRSKISCLIYIYFAILIIHGNDKFSAYKKMQKDIMEFIVQQNIDKKEIDIFQRILKNNIYEYQRKDINSSGYVIDTLEASFWCILKYDDYSSTVLTAVNLGEDTDTTAAVVGGLAGIIYDIDNIPEKWVNTLARKDDILMLADRLSAKI